MRKLLFAAVLAASIVPASASIVTVFVFNSDYSVNMPPGSIVDPTINVGDTIRWSFIAGQHSATSVAGIAEVWDSGVRGAGTFDHTFTQVGDWQYYCIIHGFDNGDQTAGGMAGVIHVTAVPEAATFAVVAVGLLPLLRRRR